MRFIELTLQNGSRTKINLEFVREYRAATPNGSVLFFNDESVFVSETYEEIKVLEEETV